MDTLGLPSRERSWLKANLGSGTDPEKINELNVQHLCLKMEKDKLKILTGMSSCDKERCYSQYCRQHGVVLVTTFLK